MNGSADRAEAAEPDEPVRQTATLTPTADVAMETYDWDGTTDECGGGTLSTQADDDPIDGCPDGTGGGSGPPPETPNPNGASHTMQIGGTVWDDPLDHYRTRWTTLLDFDLPDMPDTAVVTDAQLTVEARKKGDTVDVAVRPIAGTWSEESTGLPSISTSPQAPASIANGVDTTVDVTEVVDAWRSDGGHGLALWWTGAPGMVEIYAREKPAFQATLQVEWVDTDLSLPGTAQMDPAAPGTVTWHGGPARPGMVVEIDSAGGIDASQIRVRPDRQASLGLHGVAVSPALDISVDRPENVLGATLTLPYDETLLDGFAEDQLDVATYDEDAQLWLPVPGGATVDPVANTVTVTTDHLSLYAVVKHANEDFWSANAIERLFGTTAVRCVAEGSATGVDVALLIDSSGSMGSNDPNELRADGAKLFVDEMRDSDRAGVVSFEGTATTRIGMTELATAADRDAVKAAIDAGTYVGGSTNIGAAVREGISLLSSSQQALRVEILLTDGQDSSDIPTLVDEALDASVAIYTIGLGSGVQGDRLQALAEGTGGTYQFLESADQLPALYEQLAGDIIDDGTDTDGDGLTDCEERNGLFSPAMVWAPELGANIPADHHGVFSFPDPTLTDSDADGTDDGVEAVRTRFDEDPAFAHAFQVLIERGRTEYFRLTTGRPDRFDTDNDDLPDPVFPQLTEDCGEGNDFDTSPFAWDSDGDDLHDGLECANGTDPRDPDSGAYGIDGLGPFTLFAPDDYEFGETPRPAVDAYYVAGGEPGTLRRVETNHSSFVFYDNDYNCVSDCQELEAWAAAQDDGGAFGICTGLLGVLCTNDAEQIRNKIVEVVEQQGVFDGDGMLRTDYIATLAGFQCAGMWSESGPCTVDEFRDDAVEAAKVLPPVPLQVDPLKSDTLRRGLGPRLTSVDTARLARVAVVLAAVAIVYRHSQTTDEEREQRIEDALRTCYESKVIDVVDLIGELHPCEAMPIFLPGQADAGKAAVNTDLSIKQDFSKHVLIYASEAERDPVVAAELDAMGLASGDPRRWYRQFDPCKPGTYNQDPEKPEECDEYPYYTSTRGGPPIGPTGSRIEVVPRRHNQAEGNALRSFLQVCADRLKAVPREPYLVVPRVGANAPPTDYICPR